MYSWLSMPSLSWTRLEIMCWTACRGRKDGKFYLWVGVLVLLHYRLLYNISQISNAHLCFSWYIIQMVCSERTLFSCDNLCGNPLSCGNHYCTKTCHALKSQSSTSSTIRGGESCEECTLPCQKVITLSSSSWHLSLMFHGQVLCIFSFLSDFLWPTLVRCNYQSLIVGKYIFRRGHANVRIPVPSLAILVNVHHAKFLSSDHVTVVPWCMFSNAYITTPCQG